MARLQEESIGVLTLKGHTISGIKHLLKDSNNKTLIATGTSVPSGVSGYAKGCLFIKTDAAGGTKGLYENQGTTSSCTFNLIGAIETADIVDASITRAKMSTAGASKDLQVVSATVATTGNTDCYIIAPQAGTLTGVDFSGVDALSAHDTNYITFSITNLGQAGAGNTAMLAATDANTTKATGGAALVANGKRSLALHGTGANLVVAAGDRLLVRAAASGTLANTVTFPAYLFRFGGTT